MLAGGVRIPIAQGTAKEMAAIEPAPGRPDPTGPDHEPSDRITDPVCGMVVDPAAARHRATHAGRAYFFCGARCRERFMAEPERFIASSETPAEVPAGTQWTCPMHPEIVRDEPGSCPICGMALE